MSRSIERFTRASPAGDCQYELPSLSAANCAGCASAGKRALHGPDGGQHESACDVQPAGQRHHGCEIKTGHANVSVKLSNLNF